MAFRFSLPASDGRLHKEEEITQMRALSHRNHTHRASQAETTPLPAADRQETPLETTQSPGSHRRLVVFADPMAFSHVEDDPLVSVVERKGLLRGYESYLVEQWACSRRSPVTIVTYTGDQRHIVIVGVMSVPEDESAWGPRLQKYFQGVQQCHARPKETSLGELMVTNLSSFPSALTVIPVPDGDLNKHRYAFIVNENLKRLGCSGRAGMTLSEPTSAVKAKFFQLYRTNESIPFSDSVIELVKLCQAALSIFGNLDLNYIDGLLCDVTEASIADWWTEFGVDYYNIEPTDGILGPSTVAALLGLLMGARNRLSSYGAPINKDVFDVDSTKRGISYFQKAQKLERTRRLDRQTLHKLHHLTAKAAAGEGWGVQRAVKSTVTEIGGKRGENVLGMVGREKAGIGDIETLDLDKFIGLAHGERAKWLWQGKPRRTTTEHHERSIPDVSNILFGKDHSTTQTRKPQPVPLEEPEILRKDDTPSIYSAPTHDSTLSVTAESPGDREALRRGVFKSVAGKIGDARSGLGRIKDAVYSGGGLRGHASRPSRDDSSETAYSATNPSILSGSSAGLVASPGPAGVNRAFTWKNKPEEYRHAFQEEVDITSAPSSVGGFEQAEVIGSDPHPTATIEDDRVTRPEPNVSSAAAEVRKDLEKPGTSIIIPVTENFGLQGPVHGADKPSNQYLSQLHRRHSTAGMQSNGTTLNENRWPRRLSFADAEEAVLGWTMLAALDDDDDNMAGRASLEQQAASRELAQSLYKHILIVKENIEPWVDTKIGAIEDIDQLYEKQQAELQDLYYQLNEAHLHTKQNSQELIAGERQHITEALKDVEVLVAKLDYEINGLVSKVQDVEDGVAHFEMQVDAVELRAEELKAQLETESWLHWAVRTVTGIGTGPNITRQVPPVSTNETK